MKTKTAWYPASVNPAREGAYELQFGTNRFPSRPVMAHWSRRQGWTLGGNSLIVFRFYDKWRGLTEQAK